MTNFPGYYNSDTLKVVQHSVDGDGAGAGVGCRAIQKKKKTRVGLVSFIVAESLA